MSFEKISLPDAPPQYVARPRDLSRYACPYCLDTNFLFVAKDWMRLGIPKKITSFEIVDLLIPKFTSIAIPCDCHPSGQRKFSHIFGKHVSKTAYGKGLIAVRTSKPKEQVR
jgi:hypothetical protein